MTWLLRHAKAIGIVLLILITVTGWISTAYFRGVARAANEEGVAQTEEINNLQSALSTIRLAANRADSIRLAQQRVDSIRIAATQDSLIAAEAEAADADRRARAAAETTGMVPITLYEEVMAAKDSVISRERDRGDAERDARVYGETQADSTIVALRLQITQSEFIMERQETRNTVRLREISALQSASNSGGMFSINIGGDWWKFLIGGVAGFGVSLIGG